MNIEKANDVQELFRLVGKGVWMLQHLENAIAYFTTMIILQKRRDKSKNVSEEFADKTLEKQKKLTLGPMISTAKREKSIPPLLHNRFDKLLKERNWLIHNCITTDYLSLRSENNKYRLFERLEEFADESMLLAKEIHNLNDVWFSGNGYDLDFAFKNAEKILHEADKG